LKDEKRVLMGDAATVLASRTDLPLSPFQGGFSETGGGGPISLPAMERGALFGTFTRKPIAIRAKMFVIASAWRSYSLASPNSLMCFGVTGYDNKK
jgi:hypothetical protein